MRRRVLAAGLALSLLAPLACRQKTEEARVLEAVDGLAKLSEKKDIEAVMAFVDDGYSDFEGRNKAGLKDLLGSYFAGRMGIVVHRLGGQVQFPAAGQADLEADFALSSGAAEALRRLVRIAPDLYRLKAGLVRSGDRWLIHYAEWRAIGLAEAFPDSPSILKSLFPNSGNE